MIHFLIALALCYVLVKIPFWILGSIHGGHRRSLVGSLIRGFIMAKTFGLLRGSGGSKLATAATRRSATKTAATPDAYAKSRTTADGQYMLPLRGLRRTRPSRTTGQNATSQAGRSPGPKSAGQQLKLPLDGQWPENKPRLGRDGQYRLPLDVTRQPKPVGPKSTPPPPVPTSTPRSPARQLRLPADGQWPEHKPRLGRDGQYRLALDVHRTRTPAKPAPPAPPPRPPRRERDRQLPLPLNLPKIPPPRPGSGRDGGDRR